MLDELRAYDVNQMLTPDLYSQFRTFKRLCKRYGERTVDVVQRAIGAALIDGKEVGSIRTWDYFTPVLEEERLKRQMAHEDIRPGDVFGLHRDLSVRDEAD